MRTRTESNLSLQAEQLSARFAAICNIAQIQHEVVEKAGEPFLAIIVGSDNDFYYSSLEELNDSIDEQNPFFEKVFLRIKRPTNWIQSTECQILLRLLSDSLSVGKAQLGTDFTKRLIPFGEDTQVVSKTNHVIYGRRGSGKSSLLLWLCTELDKREIPYAWISMQQYQGRDDLLTVWQILYDIVMELLKIKPADAALTSLKLEIEKKQESWAKLGRIGIRQIIPNIVQALSGAFNLKNGLFFIIDDLYLVALNLQPIILATLNAIGRGNNIFSKVSSLENFTRLYDNESKDGFQTPGDAQIVHLDFSLINPKSAFEHIREIVQKYLRYAGILSDNSIFAPSVLERLTWVSAGVPRDALYILIKAIERARNAERAKVAVEDINMSAADYLSEKESLAWGDAGPESQQLLRIVEDIRSFCLQESHSNALLVHIENDNPIYKMIKRVSDLKFIHVIHQGFTPSKSGERYEGFLLDYAYYTGFRRSRGVKEFIDELRLPKTEELKRIPKYNYTARLSP
jgi:hypothetical protein